METTFLEPHEIVELTGRTRKDAQAKFLRALGIAHMVRPDATLVVLRDHITKAFDGQPASSRRQQKQAGPNWNAIPGGKQ